MLKQQAIDHFGGVTKLATALGITRSAVYQWGETVPIWSALRIEGLTNGKLKAPRPAEQRRSA